MAWSRLKRQHPHGVRLGHNSLGQRVLHRRRLHGLADVDPEIADLLPEAEERLYGSDHGSARLKGESIQAGDVGLQIADTDLGERTPDEAEEPIRLALIVPARVRAGVPPDP